MGKGSTPHGDKDVLSHSLDKGLNLESSLGHFKAISFHGIPILRRPHDFVNPKFAQNNFSPQTRRVQRREFFVGAERAPTKKPPYLSR
jgi:hypothetical protein